jgi:hypothetical protein
LRSFAQLLAALLLIGTVKAYLDSGWPGVNTFWKLKVVGA